MAKQYALISILALLSAVVVSSSIKAEWTDNGVAVCSVISSQLNMQMISDGLGGAYFAWEDTRNGSRDIYVQRINANGQLLWDPSGIAVCTETGNQEMPQITPDGSEGIIVVWQDYRSSYYDYDIYAQRINPTGNALWATNGVTICSMPHYQKKPCIIVSSLYAGEVIIAWEDMRNDGSAAIYAQKLRDNGTVAWAANGISICGANSCNPQIIYDNYSGAIIIWEKLSYDYNIYAQRVNSLGEIQWTSGGIPVIESSGDDIKADVVADGSGGAVVACENHGTEFVQLYAQRINSSGARCWNSSPYTFVPICASCAKFHQTTPKVAVDQWANAIITYEDGRDFDTKPDLYAQKLLSQYGGRAWTDGGKRICSLSDWQDTPAIASARYNSAIIAWEDRRDGNYDIYAQLIDADGNPLWENDGLPICTATLGQTLPRITSDGSGGAIVGWLDNRSSSNDVYASRVIPEMACTVSWEFINSVSHQPTQRDTLRGCPAGDYDSLKIYIDFNENIMNQNIDASEISLDIPDGLDNVYFWRQGSIIIADHPAEAPYYSTTITQPYISGCNICPLECFPLILPVRLNAVKIAQIDSLKVNGPDMSCVALSKGKVDLSDLIDFSGSYNKNCGQAGFNACCDFNLDCQCNLGDFSLFGIHYQHTIPWETGLQYVRTGDGISDAYVRCVLDEEVDQGAHKNMQISVYIGGADNVAAMSLDFDFKLLGLEYVGWKPNSDLGWESLILSAEEGKRSSMLMLGMNMQSLGSAEVKLGTLEVAAEDYERLDLRKMDFAFGIGVVADANGATCILRSTTYEKEHKAQSIGTTRLARNYPNPFNPSTTIEYSVATNGPVNLSIYNIKGELVRTLVDELKQAGSHTIVWDGRNNNGTEAASGVYFSRMKIKDFAESHRMILIR